MSRNTKTEFIPAPSVVERAAASPWLETGTASFNRVTVILSNHFLEVSHDSLVGIGTRLRAGRPRSRGSIPGKASDFSLLHSVQTGSGSHPESYTRGPRVKLQGREADLHIVPRSRMVELYLHSPILFHENVTLLPVLDTEFMALPLCVRKVFVVVSVYN
jgi:hypothetical protein